MIRNDEIIKSLIDETNELPHRNFVKLDALRRRAKMIFKNMFGDSSIYLLDLEEINFKYNAISKPKRPRVVLNNEKRKDQAWNYGKNILLNLFKTVLNEIELFGINNHNDHNVVKIENFRTPGRWRGFCFKSPQGSIKLIPHFLFFPRNAPL